MTLVQMFRCRACKYEQGPFGTHGFDPKTKSGELIGKCPKCQTLSVVRFAGGQFQGACHVCKTPFEGHDGRCPRCGSRECGFGF